MKLKTWHLFFIIIVLFVSSFYVINLKFDKYSRVNGINNENRSILEKYLNEDERTYLIDNQIPVHDFLPYIEENDFRLQNYQYYNALKETKRYSKKNIIEIGNSLSTRLSYLYSDHAFNYGKRLIDNQMELAFINESSFVFSNFDFYVLLKPLYNDYAYVQDCALYISRLEKNGIVKHADLLEVFKLLTNAYSRESLYTLLTTNSDESSRIVFNPLDLTILVNKQNYIATFEPDDLLLVQDIPRIRYAMYLRKEAYNSLLELYQAASQQFNGFLLREAFVSSSSLDDKDRGYSESQLGTTIVISQSQVKYDDFEKSQLSEWLENNAYLYGFVLRYPRNKASVTNHPFDAHIYRYVGKDLALQLHNAHKTLEEYNLEKK